MDLGTSEPLRSTLAAPPTHPMRQRWQCVLHVRAAGPIRCYPYPLSIARTPRPPMHAPLPIHSSPALRPRRLLREVLPAAPTTERTPALTGIHTPRTALPPPNRAPRPPLGP